MAKLQERTSLLLMFIDSQSSPSYRPSPFVAHVLWMYLHAHIRHQGRCLSLAWGNAQHLC